MKFKAGKYYIGDPCYVVPDEEWDGILEHTQFFGCNGVGAWGGEWKGFRMFSGSTAFGDGCYTDNQGRVYGVDAGMIGIVPFEYLDKNGVSGNGGQVIEFEHDFDVNLIEGVFYFGNIVIDTLGSEEDDDDYCWDCGRILEDSLCWYCDEEE